MAQVGLTGQAGNLEASQWGCTQQPPVFCQQNTGDCCSRQLTDCPPGSPASPLSCQPGGQSLQAATATASSVLPDRTLETVAVDSSLTALQVGLSQLHLGQTGGQSVSCLLQQSPVFCQYNQLPVDCSLATLVIAQPAHSVANLSHWKAASNQLACQLVLPAEPACSRPSLLPSNRQLMAHSGLTWAMAGSCKATVQCLLPAEPACSRPWRLLPSNRQLMAHFCQTEPSAAAAIGVPAYSRPSLLQAPICQPAHSGQTVSHQQLHGPGWPQVLLPAEPDCRADPHWLPSNSHPVHSSTTLEAHGCSCWSQQPGQ